MTFGTEILKTAEHCNLYVYTDFWSKFCLLLNGIKSCHVCFIQYQNWRYFRCPVWKTKSW